MTDRTIYLLVATYALGAHTAQAGLTLPAAFGSSTVVVYSEYPGVGLISSSFSDLTGGSASASDSAVNSVGGALVELQPDPTAYAAANDGSGNYVSAGSTLTYYFEVVGPQAAGVPILLNAMLSASEADNPRSGYTLAEALLYVIDLSAGSQELFFGEACTDCGNVPSVLAVVGNNALNIVPNDLIEVELDVAATATTGAAVATVDPSFNIDPSFANAGQYSIALSGGVGNPNVVAPEPGFYAPLSGGLLVLLYAKRRQAKGRAVRTRPYA